MEWRPENSADDRTMQNGSCTHVIANGGLSGSKTQKWIDGQAGRGKSKWLKVVKIECKYGEVRVGFKKADGRGPRLCGKREATERVEISGRP